MDSFARRRRLIIAATVAVLLVAGVTTARLLLHDETPPPVDPPDVIRVAPRPDTAAAAPPAGPLDELSDPEAFTRRVSQILFDWDTTQIDARRTIIETLVPVGDPTGESTAGLVADIESYLPTEEAWIDLEDYQTRQRLEIRTVQTPSTWERAKRTAGPEGLLPGTTAFTVRGTRHRAGVWENRAVSSEHPIAFTVFVVCAPAYEECHLLRLSMPDTPLP